MNDAEALMPVVPWVKQGVLTTSDGETLIPLLNQRGRVEGGVGQGQLLSAELESGGQQGLRDHHGGQSPWCPAQGSRGSDFTARVLCRPVASSGLGCWGPRVGMVRGGSAHTDGLQPHST